jgi:3-deoxy-D-manno-octulosonic-acid transferase
MLPLVHRLASRAALAAYAGLSEVVVSPLAAALAYRRGGLTAVRHTLAMCAPGPGGTATSCRPASCSYMLWVHGASIGETVTALPIVRKLLATDDRAMAVITSNTATALARLSLEELGPRVALRHQPADARSVVRRFLRCWEPDSLVLVESELWPNTLLQASSSGLPVALVNAHISESSFERWRRIAPLTLSSLLATCAVVLAKSSTMVGRLHLAGSDSARYRGDLKQVAALRPPPSLLASLQSAVGERRSGEVWLAASTHEGEEEV